MNANKVRLLGCAPPMRLAMVLVVMLGGCGGGGGGASGSTGSDGGDGGSGSGSSAIGSLELTVRDPFGEPAAHARVQVYPQRETAALEGTTDASGKIRFARVRAGFASAYAWPPADYVQGVTFDGSAANLLIPDGGVLEAGIALGPNGVPFAAVHSSWVAASTSGTDGRSVNVAFHIYSFGDVGSLHLKPCDPDPSDDTPAHRSNCVEDVAFDAPYDAPGYTVPLPGGPLPGGTAAPFRATLLLDQGSSVAANDSEDLRLFAVKYFLANLQSDDRVQLAAFASDVAGGSRALIPDTPVTLISDDSGAMFKSAGTEMFPLVDSLASQEGGASPLYTSLDSMIDFTAQNTPSGSRRAVVVLTTKADSTCGTEGQCLTARQALISKARAAEVSIVVIGIGSESQPIDVVALSELAVGSSGALLWANDARQLPKVLHGLIEILNGSAQTFEAHYQIQSPTGGAFQSGRTLLGTVIVEFTECPFGCYTDEAPFAVRIP
jgi:hypothetical protein